jgi:hypothetical protein
MPSPAPHPDRAALVEHPKSRSPARNDDRKEASRARSRSPRRSPPRKPKSYSGLKWKKPERSGDGDHDRDRDDRRGGPDRDDRRRDDRDRGYKPRDDRERRDRRDDDRRRDHRDDRDRDRRGRDRDSDRPSRSDRPPKDRASKPAAAAPPPAPVASGEPMIIVTVNDRLGTKAQIPCMASDPVKVFKAMVAAKIGRPVHEIMLKRQGERPFHDQLSLADYGVSHGVQIDLELNTGD